MRVLLIEDNPDDARIVQLALKHCRVERYELTVAECLRVALPLAREDRWDAILLDLSVPDSTGLMTLKEVSLAAPSTPIIVLTADDEEQMAVQACGLGAEDYLVKGRHDRSLSLSLRCAIARRRFNEVLAKRAHYDSLTGLVNRPLFEDRLTRAALRAERAGERLALLFIDLDDFKAINDAKGHHAGDLVLRDVAGALSRAVRESDTVARLGGDEFVILIEGIKATEDARVVAQRTQAAIVAELARRADVAPISASVGVAIFPDDARDGDTLIRCADSAMLRTKESSRRLPS